jgi:hypothetical protein
MRDYGIQPGHSPDSLKVRSMATEIVNLRERLNGIETEIREGQARKERMAAYCHSLGHSEGFNLGIQQHIPVGWIVHNPGWMGPALVLDEKTAEKWRKWGMLVQRAYTLPPDIERKHLEQPPAHDQQ